jgi:hypothetical protein
MRKLVTVLAAAGLSMGVGAAIGQNVKDQQAEKAKQETQQAPSGGQEQEKFKSGKPEQSEADRAKTGRSDEPQPKKFEEGKPEQNEAANPGAPQRPETDQSPQRSSDEKTTGQVQGLRDSGGTAEAKLPAQKEDPSTRPAGSPEKQETTGQGDGVKDSGGTADVKTPDRSANSPSDHDR